MSSCDDISGGRVVTWPVVDPAQWPVGTRVEFNTDPKGIGVDRWSPGTVVGHTPQSLRIQPDRGGAVINRPTNWKIRRLSLDASSDPSPAPSEETREQQ